MSLKSIKTNFELREKGPGYHIYHSPVRCPANEPPVPQGWELRDCGGAWPYFIAYDPQRIELVWLSARGIVEDLMELQKAPEFILDVPASVHGCWKLRKNQRIAIMKK